METVGESVREAIDLMENGRYQKAFGHTCRAVASTVQKQLDLHDAPSLVDYKQFIGENEELVRFICFPSVNSNYLETRFTIREISLNPHRDYTIKEVIVFFLTYGLKHGRLPADIMFSGKNNFEKRDGKLLVPHTLVSGLLALVVVHPVNSDQAIPDEYWINISDFKMFVSELWGRIDIAERIRKFYRQR